MGTVNVTLGDGKKLNLILGQQLENAVTAVVFDFSAWKTEFGSGTLGLSVQRHGDTQPYAVVPTVSGTNATWNISELDTAYKGVGEVQVTYTVGTKVKKSVVYKFTVQRSLGENGEYPSPGQTWQQEIEADIADVKQDLEELQSEAGVTADLKSALLQLASKVAYIDDDGQSYYDDLYDALYPNAQSITCVYTQTGTVYTATPINSLKDDLVVTAHYSDSTTRVLKPSDYTLSGTLSVGTSTVTVSYGNLTTSFTVTVTSSFSITNTLTNCVNSNSATYSTGGSYTGTISGTTVDYDVFDSDITVTMGGVDVTSTVLNNCVISISDVTGDVVITAVAHEWKTLINTDASGWAKSKATYSNGVWTITSTDLDWNAWLKPAPFLYTYAQRKTNRIRASFDLELSNYTNGDGCQFVPGTYTGNLSGSRVAYPLSQTAYSSGWMTSSGHYSLDTESLTVADIMDEGTPADSNYLGGLIYLNANSGCSAKISNFKYQYLD